MKVSELVEKLLREPQDVEVVMVDVQAMPYPIDGVEFDPDAREVMIVTGDQL